MKITALLLSLCFFSPATAFLQMVAIDSSFGPDGTGYTSNLGGYFFYTEMAVKPDGGIMLMGFQQTPDYDSMIISFSGLTADGWPDETFGNGGRVVLEPIPYDYVIPRDLIVLDGGGMLAGIYTQSNDASAFLIYRFFEDGTPDSTFAEHGVLEIMLTEEGFAPISFAIDEHENLFLYGSNQFKQTIAKLTSKGDPDLSFGNNGMATIPTLDSAVIEWGRDIVRLADGKFITTAMVDDNVESGFVTSRWNADGTPDKSFGQQGSQKIFEEGNPGTFCAIHLQPDGKIVYKDYYSFYGEVHLVRLDQNGMPDTSFGVNGAVRMKDTYGPISNDGLLLNADGTFLMPFSVEDSVRHNYVTCYKHDFSIDSSFASNGRLELPADLYVLGFCSIWRQGEEKIIVDIISENGPFQYSGLARVNLDAHTSTFNPKPLAAQILLYPNPASDMITIRFTLNDDSKLNFDLIDAQGRTIQLLDNNVFIGSGDHELTFHLKDHIQPGIYYLRMVSENQQQVYPLLIDQH